MVLKKQQHVTVKKMRLSLSACPIRVFVRVLSLTITLRHVAYIYFFIHLVLFSARAHQTATKRETQQILTRVFTSLVIINSQALTSRTSYQAPLHSLYAVLVL